MTEEEKAAAEAAAQAAAQAEADAAAAAAAAAAKTQTDDAAAAVAAAQAEADAAKAEVARLQAIADQFAGIDPEKAKADAAAVAAAEAARVEAEKAAAKAEGNFEKLRELQAAETQAAIDAANAAKEAAIKEAAEARAELNRARIDTAFANSRFLQENTILSGPKAQRLFADHVEVENGKVVLYDKPAGEAKRAKVMDNKGNPLSFDAAIEKIINADADKDTLLKSKVVPGAGSTTTEGKPANQTSRHDKLAQGLRKLRAK